MSDPDEPWILTDEDGKALAVVSGGELHPVGPTGEQIADERPSPWAQMSETELLVAMAQAHETLAVYAEQVQSGEDLTRLLAHADAELTLIEDELIRRGFAHRAPPEMPPEML